MNYLMNQWLSRVSSDKRPHGGAHTHTRVHPHAHARAHVGTYLDTLDSVAGHGFDGRQVPRHMPRHARHDRGRVNLFSIRFEGKEVEVIAGPDLAAAWCLPERSVSLPSAAAILTHRGAGDAFSRC